MFGFFRGVLWGVLLIAGGWLIGSVYPAPAAMTRPIAEHAPGVAARFGIDEGTLDSLRGLLTEEQLVRLRRDARDVAARAGEAIIVERAEESVAEQIASLPSETAQRASASVAVNNRNFETSLSLCPGMSVSNAPAADASRNVRNYVNLVDVEGVQLAVNPTIGACLSSAFGPRGSGRHKGVDYHSADGGPILAAAAGTIVEAKYRDDYGNMLLIDHGNGVYTRYAHLSNFAPGIVAGARVEAGQQIGLMGNTASYAIPVHLHYEILTGDYNMPAASFGLTPRSPFAS